MLSKPILIGLFVLLNNRTRGEPNNLQGSREGYYPQVRFLDGYRQSGKLERFFARGATGGLGINGLKS